MLSVLSPPFPAAHRDEVDPPILPRNSPSLKPPNPISCSRAITSRMASFSTRGKSAARIQRAANSAAGVQQISGMQKTADRIGPKSHRAQRLRAHIRKVPTLMGDTRRYWQRLAWHGEPGSSLWSVLVPRGLDVSVANLLEGLRAGVACAVPVFVSHVRKHGV